jgi:transposase InsO family protein
MLYYKPKKPDKDWALKCRVEAVLREHPSYGSRRIAWHLRLNRKRVKRVMNLFGIKLYRRRGKKFKRTKNIEVKYPNLLLTNYPQYENHIWATDFTYLPFQGRFVYVATVIDLYT